MPRRGFPFEFMKLKNLMRSLKSIFFEPNKSIIKILSQEPKGTNEIYGELKKRGIILPRTTLYYHLSTLEDNGIIEVKEYREIGGGAPEKVWKLKVRKIGIDLVTGEIFKE